MKGKNHYALDATETSLGTVRSLEYFVQNMEDRLAHKQSELADMEKKCGELEAKIGQPFEHEAKLKSLAVRQKELEEALDITKNQASNSLSAEETEQGSGASAGSRIRQKQRAAFSRPGSGCEADTQNAHGNGPLNCVWKSISRLRELPLAILPLAPLVKVESPRLPSISTCDNARFAVCGS